MTVLRMLWKHQQLREGALAICNRSASNAALRGWIRLRMQHWCSVNCIQCHPRRAYAVGHRLRSQGTLLHIVPKTRLSSPDSKTCLPPPPPPPGASARVLRKIGEPCHM